MKQRFFSLPENATPRTRNAIRYTSFVAIAASLTLLFDLYLCFRSGSWQLWIVTGFMFGMVVLSLMSRQLILNGKNRHGARVLIAGILIVIGATPYLVAGLGIVFAITGVMLTVLIASEIVEKPEQFVFSSFITGVIAVLADLFSLPYRLVVPEIAAFAPFIATILIVVLGFMTFRLFQDFGLRTKMIIVIVTITMLAVGTIAFLTNRSLTANLTGSIGSNLSALSNSKAVEIAQTVQRDIDLIKALSLNDMIRNSVRNASQGKALSQAEIEQLDGQWHAADASNDNTDPLVAGVLHNAATSQLRQFEEQFPQHVEVFLTNQQGLTVAATNRTSDYYQGDEDWWQTAYREGLYIGQPEYEESSKTLAVIIAIAIQEDPSGVVIGVLRTTIDFNTITRPLVSGLFGKTGQTVVYLPNRQELFVEVKEDNTFLVQAKESGFDYDTLTQSTDLYFETVHHQTPVLASQANVAIPNDPSEDARVISNLNWRVVVFQDLTEALQPVQAQTRNTVLIALIIFVLATFAALGVAQVVSGPLIRLNAVAERVAAGDLSVQAAVETGDETGTLAKTFNSMTAQLRDLIGTLEHRVAERTKALATSAEVSRYLSTILNERQLVVEVVEQLKSAFNYYHVQIYLLDEESGDLIMTGGTGDVGAALLGSGHKVPKGKGLVGRAAHNNAAVLVPDTSKDPGWLPNRLLPETKSEAAVPIATVDKVLGVLDVQHDEINGLQQEDVDLVQSIATQVAIALENARLYTEAREKADREAQITAIGQKIQSTATVENALQVAVRELGRTLNLNELRIIIEAPKLAEGSLKPDRGSS